MTQELSVVTASYRVEDRKNMDWADKEAMKIAESFVAIDGHENWDLDFDWCALNKLIARALRSCTKSRE